MWKRLMIHKFILFKVAFNMLEHKQIFWMQSHLFLLMMQYEQALYVLLYLFLADSREF